MTGLPILPNQINLHHDCIAPDTVLLTDPVFGLLLALVVPSFASGSELLLILAFPLLESLQV